MSTLLGARGKDLEINEKIKNIVKCEYYNKNTKRDSALYCLFLFCPGSFP